MPENLLKRGWYPPFNGDLDYENSTYVYSPTLQSIRPSIYKKATKLMNQSMKSISSHLEPSLQALLELAYREQAKEDAFLNTKCKIGSAGARTDGQRIKDFNSLYQRMEIFERNIRKIESINEDTKSQRIDITSSFRDYLSTEIEHLSLQDMDETSLKEAVKRAIVKAMKSKDFSGQEETKRSYLALLDDLQAMQDYSSFVDDVFEIYLGSSWKAFEEEIKKQGSATEKIEINGSRGLSGNLMEVLSQRILQTLNVDAKLTGSSGQKADLVIASYELEIPNSLIEGIESVRANFIQQWKNFYSNMKSSEDIVEISAKNYTLGNNFQGFTAQDKVTIDNFAATLEAYGYNNERLDPLVFALLNTGPDTLRQGTDEICKNISTLIAYFLFDDIDMDLNTPAKAIHLFNLDGIYVPLSSFLFAAYDSLKDFEKASKDYVSVSYRPQAVIPEDNIVGLSWEEAKINKLDQTSIKIHFFKNFTNYIKSLNLLK